MGVKASSYLSISGLSTGSLFIRRQVKPILPPTNEVMLILALDRKWSNLGLSVMILVCCKDKDAVSLVHLTTNHMADSQVSSRNSQNLGHLKSKPYEIWDVYGAFWQDS